MSNSAKVLAFIPARGGSKGVPGKNKKMLGTKPLIAWTIEDAKACDLVDRVVVSTEDGEIAAIARAWGAEVIDRPPEMATDTADLQVAIDYTLARLRDEGYRPDYIVAMFPTSPFRREGLIHRAVQIALADPRICAVNALVPLDFHMMDLLNGDGTAYTTPEIADALHGITFGFSMSFAVQNFSSQASKRKGLVLTPDEVIDIDDPEDWEAAERAVNRWV